MTGGGIGGDRSSAGGVPYGHERAPRPASATSPASGRRGGAAAARRHRRVRLPRPVRAGLRGRPAADAVPAQDGPRVVGVRSVPTCSDASPDGYNSFHRAVRIGDTWIASGDDGRGNPGLSERAALWSWPGHGCWKRVGLSVSQQPGQQYIGGLVARWRHGVRRRRGPRRLRDRPAGGPGLVVDQQGCDVEDAGAAASGRHDLGAGRGSRSASPTTRSSPSASPATRPAHERRCGARPTAARGAPASCR